MKTCLYCKGENLEQAVHMGGYSGHRIRLIKFQAPEKLIFKQPLIMDMKVLVCNDCGFVHPFATGSMRVPPSNPNPN